MRKIAFIISLIFAAILSGCGDGATKKLVKELNSSYTNDGKKVELTGYITRNGPAIVSDDRVRVDLTYSNVQQSQNAFAQALVKFGKEPNSIFIPEKFRLEDIEIYDSNGQKHGVNTEFNIKGTVHYTHKDWKENLEQKQGDKKDMFSNNPAFQKMRENSKNEAENAKAEREKKTGDPNDYSFEIIVNEISVAK